MVLSWEMPGIGAPGGRVRMAVLSRVVRSGSLWVRVGGVRVEYTWGTETA